jgi:pimeloyl-ACP methyl ester carboxylesterase
MSNSKSGSRAWSIIKKSFLILISLILSILLGAFLTETIRRSADETDLPPPGRLVDLGTHKMHLWCEGEASGSNSPTIVLDSGAGVFSTSWRFVVEDLSRDNRVCAFDRSGLGWSEPSTQPLDSLQANRELKQLLDQAGVEKPFIYVGHSLGAMMGQTYHDQYPDDLAGLLMIEPADPEIFIREIGESRGEAVDRQAPIKACGIRCPLAMTAASLGVIRIALNRLEPVNDPLFHPQSLAELKARTSRPDNVRTAMMRGRFMTTIAFQTGDVDSFGDLPVMMLTGSQSGALLGDSETPEDLAKDQLSNREAWIRTGNRSRNNLGLRTIKGANHLSIVTYEIYAKQVAIHIRELARVSDSPEAETL